MFLKEMQIVFNSGRAFPFCSSWKFRLCVSRKYVPFRLGAIPIAAHWDALASASEVTL